MTTAWDLAAVDEAVALVGHSGASVLLLSRGDERRVRKTAKDSQSNDRLMRQMRLQASALTAGVRTPAVLASGVHDECAFFEMEYVSARSVARAIVEGTPPDLEKLGGFLRDVLTLNRREPAELLDESVFLTKLAAVEGQCADVLDRLALRRAFKELRSALEARPFQIPASLAHGDFTFENILIDQKGDHILIDFDDPGFSSWMLDLAKLMQDGWGRWCLRSHLVNAARSVQAVNAQIELDRVRTAVLEPLIDYLGVDRRRLAALTILHLFRVLPYCKDDQLVKFVMANATLTADKAQLFSRV